MNGSRERLCASAARRQSVQMLLAGAAALTAGVLAGCFAAVTGILWNIRDFLWIVVILFLFFGGGYLLFLGVRGLVWPETTDICTVIRVQLRPGDERTGREALALVDADLESAQGFLQGKVLVGREWLLVRDTWARPIRLDRICKIERRSTRRVPLYLKFLDERGLGPVTGRLSAAEADAVEAYLRGAAPNLRT